MSSRAALELLDWKRRIFGLYAGVRTASDPEAAWQMWIDARRHLFRTHPQSPVPPEQRPRFEAQHFPYRPALRVFAAVSDMEPETYDIATSGNETMTFSRIGRADFVLDDSPQSLEIYWLDAYAGGLFVPFRDATSGTTTYGAGRYLLDTVKGADLGTHGGKLVLDFNFAYNPSCAYDPRWVCPLAPPANRLDIAIEAGEKTPAP
ncbi:MAG: DUF1684 domain-containing protein [Actinobacteria bacterium]|nr:DUF1684 domain-containing protein [Actinomycetota bacterium]